MTVEDTKIEWARYTFNAWRGCVKDDVDCAHCYAETGSKRSLKVLGQWGTEAEGGRRTVAAESYWDQPLKWDRQAASDLLEWGRHAHAGSPPPERPRVFALSLGDVFEDWNGPMHDIAGQPMLKLPDGTWILDNSADAVRGDLSLTMQDVRVRLFDLIKATPYLDWVLLTKRPQNIRKFWPISSASWKESGLPNLWLGTSVGNQQTANRRIPELLAAAEGLCRVRFASIEPLLGSLDMSRWLGIYKPQEAYRLPDAEFARLPWSKSSAVGPRLDWAIVGGESGPKARPCYLEHVKSLVDQFKAAGRPIFVKQLGAAPVICRGGDACWVDPADCRKPNGQCRLHLASMKGGDMAEWPTDLRVRQLPAAEVKP